MKAGQLYGTLSTTPGEDPKADGSTPTMMGNGPTGSMGPGGLGLTDKKLEVGAEGTAGYGHGAGTGTGRSAGGGATSGLAPKISAGSVTVKGRLPGPVVQRSASGHLSRFGQCYAVALKKNASLKGTVTLRFEIAADGAVGAAETAGAALADGSFERCLLDVARSMTFPQPEGGVVKVVYPIRFAPNGD